MSLDTQSGPANSGRPGRRRQGFWRKAAAAAQAAGAQPLAPPPPAAPRDPAALALVALEDVLVAQLRLAQTVDALAEQERQALKSDAPASLAEVVRAKLTCLGELARLETEGDAALAAWAGAVGRAGDVNFDEMLPHLEPAVAERLSLYRLGIEAHLEHCRALRPVNKALASAAIARHRVWRHFLQRQAAGGAAWPAEGAA